MIEETGKGFFIFISTPRGQNHFTDLFKNFLPNKTDTKMQSKLKEKWLHMWLDAKSTIKHNGEQMLSDEFLEEEKMSMGEGSFEQEYMLSLNADSQGIWYSKEIRKAYNDDRIKQYGIFSPDGQEYYGHYNPNEPVYCSWDLG